MAKRTAEAIRAALVRQEGSTGRPYPKALREAAIELLGAEQREGVGLVHVARALGVSATTLRGWQRDTSSTAPAHAAFCEVEFLEAHEAPAVAPRAIVVQGPLGLRIEGLTVAELAELMRRLA